MLRRLRGQGAVNLPALGLVVVGEACWTLRGGVAGGSARDWLMANLSLLSGCVLIVLAGPGAPAAGLYGGLIARNVEQPRVAWAARALVILTAPFAGAGVMVYAAASLVEAIRSADPVPALDWRRAAATGMLGLSAVLALAAVGVADTPSPYLWAALLVGSGLAQLWNAAGARGSAASPGPQEQGELRSLLGIVLALGGLVLLLNHILHVGDIGRVLVATTVALAVIAFVGGPWWVRNRRILDGERLDRALAVQRAELADQLHDSVLQTLALIQRRADDPETVAMLARRQERELRDWLLGRRSGARAHTLQDGLRALIADLEDRHGISVETVTVGEALLDGRGEALLAAVREALINATRHAPGAPVSVFMRSDADLVQVFVHDRGPGFDPAAIAADRHGINDSIIARMQRNGGQAEIHSAPGSGCEIILSLPLE